MPNWKEVREELTNTPSPLDGMRRKYVGLMHQYTGRNVIAYYSAFVQKPSIEGTGIDDNDMNAFMQTIHGLDKTMGLDLILHTPGGAIASAESIVCYLKSIFGKNIRVFVPQMAMSAGTMIALSAKEIVMGKQSNLGPIDPQFGGLSCAAIVEEFETALNDVTSEPKTAAVWGPIIGKYHPTFVGDCKKSIAWSETIVKQWLVENMFSECDSTQAGERAENVVHQLSSHSETFSHSRHIHRDTLKEMGVNVIDLEGLDNRSIGNCKDLQDCVLTTHHSYMEALSASDAIKIVENHNGSAMIMNKKK